MDTFETAHKTVLETYIREVDKLVHLTINGELITTTVNHPFYVKDHGFVVASELYVGDKLLDSDGNVLIVEDIRIEIVKTPVKVYNFKVEDWHTYYVGDIGVLVHNADCTIEFNNKSGLDNNEYKQQLSDQQDGLNNLTVEKYQNNRASYEADGRASDSAKYQQSARQESISSRTNDNIRNGMSFEDANSEATNWAKGKSALHGPDQKAGGNANNITGLGDSRINSSIGSQWKANSRIGTLDEYVNKLSAGLTDAQKKSTYLDVELMLK